MSGALLAEPLPGHASARCLPASHPPALTLRLLGGFELRHESGEVVRVARPRKKAQALLAYLACHRGQAHLRDKLAALLWPDMGGVSGTIERVADGFKERLPRDLETVGAIIRRLLPALTPREPSVLPPSADIRPKEDRI